MTQLKNAKLLEQYAKIAIEIKKLETVQSDLRAQITESFVKDSIEKVEHPLGTFSIMRTPRWSYSAKVVSAEEKLKIAKVREQEKGIAKATFTETVRFNQKKEL